MSHPVHGFPLSWASEAEEDKGAFVRKIKRKDSFLGGEWTRYWTTLCGGRPPPRWSLEGKATGGEDDDDEEG